MGLYIVIAIIFVLFLAAAFIAARLDDKLQKERNLVKSLLNDIAYLKAQNNQQDNKFKIPTIKVEEAIEVASRLKYIPEDLKSIADFVLEYSSWNLHKDEWSSPVLEVPLFRVLDALIQRGKPYMGG